MADGVSAYAKLAFDSFDFYIQTLRLVIGRRTPEENGSAIAPAEPPLSPAPRPASPSERPAKEQSKVDVDLGPIKAVSREHACLFYHFALQNWVLDVKGRNGVVVDGKWHAKGESVEMGHRTKIQIAERIFHFVLPNTPEPIPQDTRDAPSEHSTVYASDSSEYRSDAASSKRRRTSPPLSLSPEPAPPKSVIPDIALAPPPRQAALKAKAISAATEFAPPKKVAPKSPPKKKKKPTPAAKTTSKAKTAKKKSAPTTSTDEYKYDVDEGVPIDPLPTPPIVPEPTPAPPPVQIKQEDPVVSTDIPVPALKTITAPAAPSPAPPTKPLPAKISAPPAAKPPPKTTIPKSTPASISTPRISQPAASSSSTKARSNILALLPPESVRHVTPPPPEYIPFSGPRKPWAPINSYQGKAAKPPFSFPTLIAQAILNSQDKKLELTGICDWIAERYPFYRDITNPWQASVQQCLSTGAPFIKIPPTSIPVDPNAPPNRSKWAMDPKFADNVDGMSFARTSTTPATAKANGTKAGTKAATASTSAKAGSANGVAKASSATPAPKPGSAANTAKAQSPAAATPKKPPLRITVGPLPPDYVKPATASNTPAAVNDAVAAKLLKDPPMTVWKDQLILNPSIFSHLTPDQLSKLQRLETPQCLQVLQRVVVEFFKKELKKTAGSVKPPPSMVKAVTGQTPGTQVKRKAEGELDGASVTKEAKTS